MAFVYRASRNSQKMKRASTPGPAIYFKKTNPSPSTNSAITFLNKCNRQLWNQSTTPGPGEYEIEKQTGNADIHNILVVEKRTGTASSCFQSKSKRLNLTKPYTPGPGQYQLNLKDKQISKRFTMSAKPTKLSKYLFAENQKERNSLVTPLEQTNENVQNPRNNEVYHVKKQQKFQKESQCFTSKVERVFPNQVATSGNIGPGAYQIAQSFNFIDSKPLHFNEDTQKKGKLKLKMTATIYEKENQQKNRKSIGPGTYQSKSSSFQKVNPSSSKGIQCFGSKQSRFGLIQNRASTPGPQSYCISKETPKTDRNPSKKKVPLKNSAEKHYITQAKGDIISPASYNPQTSFTQMLVKNINKNSVGNFGSTVQRFKSQMKQNPKKQKEINQNSLIVGQSTKQKKVQQKYSKERVMKYVQKRILIKLPEEDSRPLCYDTNYETIEKKYNSKYQRNIPFLTGTERFDELNQNIEQCILEDLKKFENQRLLLSAQKKNNLSTHKLYKKSRSNFKFGSAINFFRKTMKQTGLWVKKQEEKLIGDKVEERQIGPQTYSMDKPLKSKSFNILFKESQ